MFQKLAVMASALWAAPSCADSATENLLNDLLDLSQHALVDPENTDLRLLEFVEGAEIISVADTKGWPLRIDDPYGVQFTFDAPFQSAVEPEVFSFNCIRFGEVAYNRFSEVGLVEQDVFDDTNPHFRSLDVAGAADLPDAWPENTVAKLSCLGTHFKADGKSPLPTDGLRAFFDKFKTEDDVSQQGGPTMIVADETYLFELRSGIDYPSHRITNLRVESPDPMFTSILVQGYLLHSSS
ncbi:hypothetical protein [Pelagivirga sediminicola]|uniref:hypothetical protein n=1 Tax=Pelagivirga sediminicola TaxID=2170575 RepID=UPI0010575833|nr:hypothetical protein [Pelagivirga sediminicola]